MDKNDLLSTIMNLFHEVDKAFISMKEKYPAEVCCAQGCDDCCHACFSVSLAEAILLNKAIKSLNAVHQQELTSRAQKTQKKFNKLEREVRTSKKDSGTVMSRARLKCPFLLANKSCVLYDVRPVTCRAYGLPTSINGEGHVCGFSNFNKGKDYTTIKLDNIHRYLLKLSEEACQTLQLDKSLACRRYFIHEIVLEKTL